MKLLLLFALSVSFAGSLMAEIPQIRFTEKPPFADGRRDESVWKRADVCTRFLEVLKNDVALDQSEVRMLFDEQKLYVTMKGLFDPAYEFGKKPGAASNNFEIFVRPDGAKDYLQVIVSESGKLYVARTGSQLRTHGVTAKTEGGKGFWTADLTIPLKTLGLAAPKDELKAKVGLFRQNDNVHERQKLFSERRSATSFTPMARYQFGVPDTWADMVLTRDDGAARRVSGPDNGLQVNLFANADFDIPERGWYPSGKTAYQETMAMSGEWIFRASGKDYQVLQVPVEWLKPSTRYTLVVKARSFGAGSGLRVVEMVDDSAGKRQEGVRVANLVPVGSEFHEYHIPFTSSPDTPRWMVFYKVDDGADNTGIDFASIKLYEGEISSFEIRRIGRPGRMAPIAGTEVPVPPSAYGRIPKPLRALVLTTNAFMMREPEMIFSGTGAKIDVLQTQGKDQDVYLSDGDPKAIAERLKKGEYDLYMVPAKGAVKVGKELAGYILENVKKGAGLYLERNKDPLHFKPVAQGGAYGKGRVHLASLAGETHDYLPQATFREYGPSFFPRERFIDPQVTAEACRTAFGESAPAVRESVDELVYAGECHRVTKGLDDRGNTVSWTREATPLKGAKLGAFRDKGENVEVEVENVEKELTLVWAFADFSGRILAKGKMPVRTTEQSEPSNSRTVLSFAVPREKLYTNYGSVRLRLQKNDKTLDQRGECVFVPENDRRRLYADFTPSMWPPSGTLGSIPAANRQLEEIGIRASHIPTDGYPAYELFLSTGLGVGGDWLIGSEVFGGGQCKDNVRLKQFNTAASRGYIAERARKRAAATKRYGILDQAICDEPQLCSLGTADEVDAHSENVAEYRRRMVAKYGTIAEYNRRHETAHRDFADIGPCLQAEARACGKFAEFIEWRNFNVDRWCEALKVASDNARAVDPEVPFMMNNSFGQSALSGNDYYKLLTRAGLGVSVEYTAMVYFGRNPIYNFDEFYRSFRPDMRVWGWTGYFYTPERARFMPWWFAAHRYGGFSWYHADAPGYNLIDPKTFAQTIDGKELKASLEDSRLLDGLGKVLTCWPWAKHDTAIYYSHDSMLLATIQGKETKNAEVMDRGPLHDYLHSRQGAQYTVEDLLYQHDFVAPEQIVRDRKLVGYKALLMPRIRAMSDAEVASVKDYLAQGGRVMADELPGDYDELGVKRAANPFAGADGFAVLGRNFDDADAGCRERVRAFLRSAGATPALASEQMIERTGREAMHYVSGDADLYVVLRMPGRSVDDEPTAYRFAKRGHVYDVRARKYLGVTDRVTAKTPLAEASVFAVLPARVDGIAVSGLPEIVTRGADLSLDVAPQVSSRISGSPSANPDFVYHVEFVAPSGRCRFHMKRNVPSQGGKAHVDFPTAFNDEVGAWTLRVVEPLTGRTAEKNFLLR